jgi:hypothetical protein
MNPSQRLSTVLSGYPDRSYKGAHRRSCLSRELRLLPSLRLSLIPHKHPSRLLYLSRITLTEVLKHETYEEIPRLSVAYDRLNQSVESQKLDESDQVRSQNGT